MLQVRDGSIAVAGESPDGPGQRIEAAEIIEHRATDSVACERLEFDVSAAIIPIGGFDQAGDACRYKIVEKDAGRAAPVKLPGEHSDLRQMIEDGLFAFAGRKSGRRFHVRAPFRREAVGPPLGGAEALLARSGQGPAEAG